MFEDEFVREVFALNNDEVIETFKILHNEEFSELYAGELASLGW